MSISKIGLRRVASPIKPLNKSMLARGRARHGPETTVVAARLFGSLNGFAGLPNEIFWLVVEYAWLGDWRHP